MQSSPTPDWRARLTSALLAACLIATAIDLLPAWRTLDAQPGIDFSHYWGVAQVRTHLPRDRGNPYRYLDQYNQLADHLAQASGDARWLAAHALRAKFDLTNTPLLYSVAALYPARYSRALTWHRAVEGTCVSLAALLLLAMCGALRPWPLLLAGLVVAGCAPLLLDLEVGNIAGVQLLGLVIAIALARHTPTHTVAGLLNLAWLPLLTLLKPNFALADALLWFATLLSLPVDRRLAGFAISVAGGALSGLLASHYFSAPAIWLDWLHVLFTDENRLAYDYELGNYSTALWLARACDFSLHATSLALFALVTAVLVLPRYVQGRAMFGPHGLPPARHALAWASLGIVVSLASAPLVWRHYYVLAVIPCAYLLLQTGIGRAARLLGMLGVLVVTGSVHRAAANSFSIDAHSLRVIDCLSWLPLALGLLVARLRSD